MQNSSTKRKLGRPRRLTLEQVISAACEIGLSGLDMASVAQKLGIGIATLYGYVDDREHLLQLVAAKLANGEPIEDRGQSWEDVLREHAEMVYNISLTWPQLFVHQVDGLVGFFSDSPNTNILLGLLLDRGLAPEHAILVYQQVNTAVAGAALSVVVFDRWREDCGGEPAMLRKLRAACEEHDYSALRLCLDAIDFKSLAQDYRPGVEEAIRWQRERMRSREKAEANTQSD